MAISNTDNSDVETFLNERDKQFDDKHPQQIGEDFEFDSSDVNEDDIDSGGQVDREGWYHFTITKVEMNLGLNDEKGNNNTPHISVTCKTLADPKGLSPAGSVLWHKMWVGAKEGGLAKKASIDSMYRFGIGCGLLKWGRVTNPDGSQKSVVVLASTGLPKIPVTEWHNAVGKQFIAKVVKDKDSIKPDGTPYPPKFVIPMGRAYRPDDPEYAGVVKNAEMAASIGLTLPAAGAAPAQKTAPVATSAVKTQTAATTAPAAQAAPAASAVEFSMDDY